MTPKQWRSKLHPELRKRAYIKGKRPRLHGDPIVYLNHPFMHDNNGFHYREHTPDQVNEWFEKIKQRAADYRSAKDWMKYMVCHERPYRIEAFYAVQEEMTDREYWSTLGLIWTDSENIFQYRGFWMFALMSPRPEREYIMSEEDRAVFNALPKRFTVYRGCNHLNEDGFSWTLKREVAEWFIGYNAKLDLERGKRVEAGVIERVVEKSDCIAYFGERKEEEILTIAGDRK